MPINSTVRQKWTNSLKDTNDQKWNKKQKIWILKKLNSYFKTFPKRTLAPDNLLINCIKHLRVRWYQPHTETGLVKNGRLIGSSKFPELEIYRKHSFTGRETKLHFQT